MFDNPAWLDIYLNFELATYIRDVTTGALDDQRTLRSGAYSQHKTDSAGKIGSGESFTEGGRVPTLEKLLSGNNKMRQAYAAVDLERHRRSLGDNHAQTQALRRAVLSDNNPYLGVDLAAVLGQMQQNAFPDAEGKKKFAYLHEYMDAAIKPARAAVAEAAPAPKENDTVIAPEKIPVKIPEAATEDDADAPRPVPPRDTLAQAKPAAQQWPRAG